MFISGYANTEIVFYCLDILVLRSLLQSAESKRLSFYRFLQVPSISPYLHPPAGAPKIKYWRPWRLLDHLRYFYIRLIFAFVYIFIIIEAINVKPWQSRRGWREWQNWKKIYSIEQSSLYFQQEKKHSPSWKITLAQTNDLPTTPLRLVIRQSINLKLFSLLIHDTRLKRRPKWNFIVVPRNLQAPDHEIVNTIYRRCCRGLQKENYCLSRIRTKGDKTYT